MRTEPLITQCAVSNDPPLETTPGKRAHAADRATDIELPQQPSTTQEARQTTPTTKPPISPHSAVVGGICRLRGVELTFPYPPDPARRSVGEGADKIRAVEVEAISHRGSAGSRHRHSRGNVDRTRVCLPNW